MIAAQSRKENRSYPRLDFHSEIRYQLRGKQDFDNAISNNISSGGVRFTNQKFIPASTLLMLEINVGNRVLRPIGRVAWSNSLAHTDRNQMGIEFVEFNNLERDYLNDFIKMQVG